MSKTKMDKVREQILEQVRQARAIHPPMISIDHSWGVIKEELEEFFDSVRNRPVDYVELAQVAACCLMAMVDIKNYTNLSEVMILNEISSEIDRNQPVSDVSCHETYTVISRCMGVVLYTQGEFRNMYYSIVRHCIVQLLKWAI